MLGERTQEEREEHIGAHSGESLVESVSVHETLCMLA